MFLHSVVSTVIGPELALKNKTDELLNHDLKTILER